MLKLRILGLLAPALLLALACEDESSSSSGAVFSPEAGPGFEAGPATEPEAGPGPLPEAGADSFVPPVLVGVTVTVLEDGAPKKDIRIILHDATGAVTGEMKSDVTGKATLATPPSMVTVLSRSDADPTAPLSPVTFMGVADGDKLVVTIPSYAAVPTVGRYSVSFEQGGASAGATDFIVNAGGSCNRSVTGIATPLLLDVRPSCLKPPITVIAGAYTDTNPALAIGFAKNVAAPAAGGTVNLGPIAWAAPGATTLTATSLPALATDRYAEINAIVGGAGFFTGSGSGVLDAGGMTFKTATGFAEAYESLIHVRTSGAGPTMEKALLRREATTAPATSTLPNFDFATALPFITNATLVRPMPARPDVTLTADAPLTTSSGGLVRLEWTTASGDFGEWNFVLPPSASAFKVPALPADAAAFLPSDSVLVGTVTFVGGTSVPGYNALKMLPVRPGFAPFKAANPHLAAAGTVKLTAWSP